MGVFAVLAVTLIPARDTSLEAFAVFLEAIAFAAVAAAHMALLVGKGVYVCVCVCVYV